MVRYQVVGRYRVLLSRQDQSPVGAFVGCHMADRSLVILLTVSLPIAYLWQHESIINTGSDSCSLLVLYT